MRPPYAPAVASVHKHTQLFPLLPLVLGELLDLAALLGAQPRHVILVLQDELLLPAHALGQVQDVLVLEAGVE